MLEELGISSFTLWSVITLILVFTGLNLFITLSVATFVLRVADQIKSLKDNFAIPPDYDLIRRSGNVSGLKDVSVGPADRNVRRTVITERLDDNGNVIEKEAEPL